MSRRRYFPIVLAVLLLSACTEENRTTSTRSNTFGTQEEKMAFLRRYLTEQRGLTDTEFSIVYQDNGQGRVPGPSDYTIVAALKVDTAEIGHWMPPASARLESLPSLRPWSGLGLDSGAWRTRSIPMVFQETGMQKVIYASEGIVLAHYSTHPLQW